MDQRPAWRGECSEHTKRGLVWICTLWLVDCIYKLFLGLASSLWISWNLMMGDLLSQPGTFTEAVSSTYSSLFTEFV